MDELTRERFNPDEQPAARYRKAVMAVLVSRCAYRVDGRWRATGGGYRSIISHAELRQAADDGWVRFNGSHRECVPTAKAWQWHERGVGR